MGKNKNDDEMKTILDRIYDKDRYAIKGSDGKYTFVAELHPAQAADDESKSDTIHQDYYLGDRKYEPWDVIADWDLDFFLGSAVKYIARAGKKPGNTKQKDLEKAIQYIKKEIEIQKEENQ